MDTQYSQDNDKNQAAPQSRRRRTTRGMTRRHLFNRTALATGTLAFLSSGATALAAASSAQETQALENNQLISTAPSSGKLREYWIQADSFLHNLVPTGTDAMSNTNYMANQSSYWAIGYRAYTSDWE